MDKQPWETDLEEFKKLLNPKSKSYKDVIHAVEVAWQAAFNKYATMLIFKDESENQDGLNFLKHVDKDLDWVADYKKWAALKAEHTGEEAWGEAYNTYVAMGQTQAALDSVTNSTEEVKE